MQLKDIFSASSDGVSQPSNSTLRFKQKALAASILAALAIIAFIAVEASDTKPARKAPPEAAMITLRPDGTDKDVLIARYDANFLALSRRIEEVQRREIMRPQEVREPCCQSFQIKGCSVPAGKQQVILHCFAILHPHSTRPRCPNAKPFRFLIKLVLPQHIHTVCTYLECTV